MKTILICLLLLVLAIGAGLVGACAPGTRQSALSGTLVTLNATRDGIAAYSAKAQVDIVASSPTREAAESALAKFRTERAAVVDSLALAYEALATAAVTKTDLATLAPAVADVAAAIAKLKADFPKKETP